MALTTSISLNVVAPCYKYAPMTMAYLRELLPFTRNTNNIQWLSMVTVSAHARLRNHRMFTCTAEGEGTKGIKFSTGVGVVA